MNGYLLFNFNIFNLMKQIFGTAVPLFIAVLLVTMFNLTNTSVYAQEQVDSNLPLQFDSNLPTTITADLFSLDSKTRRFSYQNKVYLVQGDLKISSDKLEGTYTEKNKISTLTATGKVIINKANLRTQSDRAVYSATTRIIVLSESPKVSQDGGTLTADTIDIILDENRSVAKGNVKVILPPQKQG